MIFVSGAFSGMAIETTPFKTFFVTTVIPRFSVTMTRLIIFDKGMTCFIHGLLFETGQVWRSCSIMINDDS